MIGGMGWGRSEESWDVAQSRFCSLLVNWGNAAVGGSRHALSNVEWREIRKAVALEVRRQAWGASGNKA